MGNRARIRVMQKLASSGAIVVALLAGWAIPAAASQSAVATGTYIFVPTSTTHIRAAGGNSFDLVVAKVTAVGGVTGIATDTETDVTHADGSVNIHGTEVCDSCSIGGRTGSYVAMYSITLSVAGVVDGHLTFTSGSGGLAGLAGEGTFTADTYSYNYHFGP